MPTVKKTAHGTKRSRGDDTELARSRKAAREGEPVPPGQDDSEAVASSEPPDEPPVTGAKGGGRPRKTTQVDGADLSRMREYLTSTRPLVQGTELDDIVGPVQPVFTAKWTQQDEDKMMDEWNSSPEKESYASMRPNPSLKALWKVCMRIFRCTPLDLLSPLLQLRYNASVVLAQKFCNALSPLIPHPVWKGSAWRLAMALQYAIICRTDDRRPWRLEPICPALKRLNSSIRRVKGSKMPFPIHQMHHEARAAAVSNRDDPSAMSDILDQIGDTVEEMLAGKGPRAAGETTCKGHEVYCVTNQDLIAVTKALDRVTSGGYRMFARVEECYEAFKQARDSYDAPSTDQLRDFHERAGRQQLRRLAKKARKNEPKPDEELEADEELETELGEDSRIGEDLSLMDVDRFSPNPIGVDDDGGDGNEGNDDDDDFASSPNSTPVPLRGKAPTSAPEVTSQLDAASLAALEKRLYQKIRQDLRQELCQDLRHLQTEVDALRRERQDETPLDDFEMEDLGDVPPGQNSEEHLEAARIAEVDNPKANSSARRSRSVATTAPSDFPEDMLLMPVAAGLEKLAGRPRYMMKSAAVNPLPFAPGTRWGHDPKLNRHPLYTGTHLQRLAAMRGKEPKLE